MQDRIENLLKSHGDKRSPAVLKFHKTWLPSMKKATGSSGNHQFWEGGYYDHISDCFFLAHRLWCAIARRPVPFDLHNALYVLYFHDIEKLWKYTDGWFLNKDDHDKEKFYLEELPQQHDFWFEDMELNALKYIHGEGDDYRKDKRVMNELAGFCHSIDVLSARVWHNSKPGE